MKLPPNTKRWHCPCGAGWLMRYHFGRFKWVRMHCTWQPEWKHLCQDCRKELPAPPEQKPETEPIGLRLP